uniref:G-protein coupled receptors family 1 profile domain-containing protein n=1 Tax=Knipowitschia caucasica TaxID=637954 RepID=A0AAV2MF62_KNICA
MSGDLLALPLLTTPTGTTAINSSEGAEHGWVQPQFTVAAQCRVVATLLLCVCASVSNTCVLVSVWRTRGLASHLRPLMLSLAGAHLMGALLVMPMDAAWNITVQWRGGAVLCKLLCFLKLLCMHACAHVVIVISLDRQHAILRPLRALSAHQRNRRMLTAAWLLSVLLATPQTSVKYLGHIVSEKGVETDPGKIEALKSWPIPTNLKELRSFLGFAGYYRRFIKDYASFTKPLNDLTKGYGSTRKSNKKGSVHGEDPPFTLVESLSVHVKAIPDCYAAEDLHGLPELPELAEKELRDRQQADPAFHELFIFRLSKALDVDFTQCATHGSFSERWQETLYNMFHFITLYVCPLVVMVWCYSCILLHIQRQATVQKAGEWSLRRSGTDIIPKARMKTVKMSVIMVLSFVVCWTPYYLLGVWYWFQPSVLDHTPEYVHHTLFVFGNLNSCLDPIIYGFYSPSFRAGLRQCCRRRRRTTVIRDLNQSPAMTKDQVPREEQEMGSLSPEQGELEVRPNGQSGTSLCSLVQKFTGGSVSMAF